MLQVKHAAMEVIRKSLKEQGAGPDQGMRVKERDGAFSLELDTPTDNDRVIRYFGSTILIVGRGIDQGPTDVVVDAVEGPDGPQVSVHHAM